MKRIRIQGVRALILGMAGASVLACSTSTSLLRARYAKERSCPESRVSVTEQGGAVYHAAGCGQRAEYICESFAGFGNSAQRCQERGLNPHEPSGVPPSKVPSRPDLVGPK